MKEGQKAKRIAIVASSCPPIVTGGISSAHYNLYRALKRRGFIVKVFTYTDHNNHLDVDDDILRFGTPKLLLKMLNIVTIFYHSVLLRIETFQHAYQFPYILESACGSLKVSRALRSFKPNVLILPDNGAPGFFIKKVAHCTSVFISHHNFLRLTGEPLLGKFARRDAQLSHRIEKKSLKKIDKVICPSNYMKAIFNQTHNFDGPVAVIPNIVDAALIDTISANDIRKVLSLPDNAPVIYIPSAGSSLKGSQFVFELIRRIAAACGREIGFYLSGDIDDLVKRELCFVPPNAKIFAPGHSSYNENISVVKACSFCVSPTLIESFGLAILEANFCGLPVVTFDVGGTADIIVNGENGILVPFLDIEALIFY
jgi:glycosyltransferase involved in cell wall biosynthesis